MNATKTLPPHPTAQHPTDLSRSVSLMGRVGYAARGTIYFLVGASAALAAIRPEHRPGGMTEALQPLQNDWTGGVVLVLLTAGLACLAGWFAVAGLSRSDHTGAARAMVAAAMLGDAAVYVGFTVIVTGFALGFWPHSGEHTVHVWSAWLLSYAYGRVLLGMLGAIVCVCGVGLMVWSTFGLVGGSLALSRDERRVIRLIGRCGIAGRGAAIALIGCYLFVAALDGNAREAHELGGMLTELRAHPYGVAAIALFALAFIASSLLDFVTAGFRRFDPTRP